MNLANAVIVIACMYFLIYEKFGFWAKAGIILILLFALATWGYWSVTNDHKRLLKMQIDEAEARIRNLNASTTFTTTQSALTLKGIKAQ